MNNLCFYCKSQTLSGKCACFPDFIIPTGMRVLTCSYFDALNPNICDVVFSDKKDIVIGLSAPTFKRSKNKNQKNFYYEKKQKQEC